jgi:hypothetical protein
LWYGEPNAISNAIGFAKFYSRSHDAVIRVYDEAGNLIDTHEHAGGIQRAVGSTDDGEPTFCGVGYDSWVDSLYLSLGARQIYQHWSIGDYFRRTPA